MKDKHTHDCIVTGFDYFGKIQSNPSDLAVQLLPKTINISPQKSIHLTRITLPSCCNKSREALQQAFLDLKYKPSLLLLTGVASKRKEISLERFALNIRDYKIPDNLGHQWQNQPIEKKGPDAIQTKFPLVKVQEYLTEKNYSCEISNSAGTFICNEIYYRALKNWQNNNTHILFVHLPTPRIYAQTHKLSSTIFDTKSQTAAVLKIYSSFLKEIIRFTYTQIIKLESYVQLCHPGHHKRTIWLTDHKLNFRKCNEPIHP